MMRCVAALAVLVTLRPEVIQAQDVRARALVMFEAGVEHYEAGRFQAAADLFSEANEIYPEPLLLYNLARAQESLGQLEQAADSYRQYLGSDPDDRPAVEARLRIIDSRLEERQRLEEEANRPPPVVAPDPVVAPSRAGPIVLLSVGAVTTLAGGALVAIGQLRGGDINDADTSLDDASDARRSAVRFNRAGFIAGGVGLAMLVGGIVWLAGARNEDGDGLAFRF